MLLGYKLFVSKSSYREKRYGIRINLSMHLTLLYISACYTSQGFGFFSSMPASGASMTCTGVRMRVMEVGVEKAEWDEGGVGEVDWG